MSGGHVFVDETKRRGYLVVAVVIVPQDVDTIRRALRELILPGQRRLHMKDENDRRKRALINAIAGADVTATVYNAGRRYRTERERRAACLRALVEDAAASGHARLIIEQDDSMISFDNQRLIEATRATGCGQTLRYEHRRASSEIALAVPDAIAWCWAKGGDGRRRAQPVVSAVRQV